MKIILFFFLFFQTFALLAEEFTFHLSKTKSTKISIQRLNGIQVNAECLKEKKACLKIIDAAKKRKADMKKNKEGAFGNPASLNCEAHQGDPEILTDKKNNEYDYCLFDNKFLLDSWDLME